MNVEHHRRHEVFTPSRWDFERTGVTPCAAARSSVVAASWRRPHLAAARRPQRVLRRVRRGRAAPGGRHRPRADRRRRLRHGGGQRPARPRSRGRRDPVPRRGTGTRQRADHGPGGPGRAPPKPSKAEDVEGIGDVMSQPPSSPSRSSWRKDGHHRRRFSTVNCSFIAWSPTAGTPPCPTRASTWSGWPQGLAPTPASLCRTRSSTGDRVAPAPSGSPGASSHGHGRHGCCVPPAARDASAVAGCGPDLPSGRRRCCRERGRQGPDR